MRRIFHISTHYFPVNGGQQLYIHKLIEKLHDFDHFIIQLADESLRSYPANVYPISVASKLRYKAVAFYAFNFLVKRKVDELVRLGIIDVERDVVICHYAFHLSAVKQFKNRISLSHGVEWDGPGSILRKFYHFHRKTINLRALNNPRLKVVANDINFFVQLGFKGATTERYFSELAPLKWLVPNCVDIEKFSSKTNQAFPVLPAKSIVIPRNIVPQRGMEVVIRSFAELIRHSDFAEYQLFIVGAVYDEAYFEELKILTDSLKVDGSVVFFGSVPAEQMPAIFAAASLTVIFSLFREGTSLAALESMSIGTPVITSNIGGLKEIPSVKADRNTLALQMRYVLENRIEVGREQQKLVRISHNDQRWVAAWRTIINA